MDAVTYPNQEVVQYLSEHFVCFKPPIESNGALAKQYGVAWTPGLVWLDEEGVAHHQNVGYFAPDELLAESALGRGKIAVGKGDWKEAVACFSEVVDRWPSSFAAPAALYWRGAASMMETHDSKRLMENWNRLLDDYGDSAWAMKVSFLRDEQ
jgi:tetratricopeptide (TPR) repeat protein